MRLRKDPDKQAWTVEAQTDEEGAFLALILDALVLKFPPNNPLGVFQAIRSPDYKTFDRTTGPNPPGQAKRGASTDSATEHPSDDDPVGLCVDLRDEGDVGTANRDDLAGYDGMKEHFPEIVASADHECQDEACPVCKATSSDDVSP